MITISESTPVSQYKIVGTVTSRRRPRHGLPAMKPQTLLDWCLAVYCVASLALTALNFYLVLK